MRRNLLRSLLEETPIVVTGMGAVTAAGVSVDALWESVMAARVPAVSRSYSFGGGANEVAVCVVEGPLDVPLFYPKVQRMDRSVQFAMTAVGEALERAGLAESRKGLEVGVVMGSSRGPLESVTAGLQSVGQKRVVPTLAVNSSPSSSVGALAAGLGLQGPGMVVSAACASSAHAVGLAAEQLLLGKADVMLAAGSEALILPGVIQQFRAAGLLGSHPDPCLTCRPFDVSRNGLCLGEGAGCLVLETEESARRRGVAILGYLAGWGFSMGRGGRAGVVEDGVDLLGVVEEALGVAGVGAGAVDLMHLHGTGTRLNDRAEAGMVGRLFGKRIGEVPCMATKPVTGHCFGATPVLESIVTLEALRRGWVPGRINCMEQDPECGVCLVPSGGIRRTMRYGLLESLGFWGFRSSLLFCRA
ncbi:MAG: beta-ketoacyl-[acyl-carrier-protein] synthase family protein [Limisphaerales bacterium]